MHSQRNSLTTHLLTTTATNSVHIRTKLKAAPLNVILAIMRFTISYFPWTNYVMPSLNLMTLPLGLITYITKCWTPSSKCYDLSTQQSKQYLANGDFPSQWHFANVIPILKPDKDKSHDKQGVNCEQVRGFDGVLYKLWLLLMPWLAASRYQSRRRDSRSR